MNMGETPPAMVQSETQQSTTNLGESLLIGGGIPKHLKSLPSTNRRKFLVATSMGVAGVLIGGSRVQGAIFSSMSSKPVPGIPHAWVQAKGMDVLRYANYIQSLNLQNITPRMVIAPHFKTRGRTHNTLPPQENWTKIAATLRVADKMVVRMSAPLREITSAYRSPRYNRAVGGKSHSYHMRNVALDLQFRGVSASHANYVAKQLRREGLFKGGIGRYPSFVHVDTRGTNVSW